MDQEGKCSAAPRATGSVAAVIGKELRGGSRRPWRHFTRIVYLLMLAAAAALAYGVAIGDPAKATDLSRMAIAGRAIITRIVFFQFFAVQVAVAIILSPSISGELDSGTLAVLKTSLLTNSQIVVGKLVAGVLQVIILLACSLPILMILRSLGGVRWEYVLASLYITFTAAVIAGAVTIAVSAGAFKSGRTVMFTLIILSATHIVARRALAGPVSAMLTPMGGLTYVTRQILNPAAATPSLSWWLGYSFFQVVALTALAWTGALLIRTRALPRARGPCLDRSRACNSSGGPVRRSIWSRCCPSGI